MQNKINIFLLFMDVNFHKEKQNIFEDTIETVQQQFTSLVITDKEFYEQQDNGNIQYRLDLSKKNKIDWEKLIVQMSFRLEEGNGECFYELGMGDAGEKIGLSEEDLKESVENLEKVAVKLEANIQIMKFYRGKLGLIAEVLIRKNWNMSMNKEVNKHIRNDNSEIKIGLFGDETSGKSTVVGVLVNGTLDNGDGSARHNIFRYQHEIQCGKTSSLSHQIVGFNQDGNIFNSTNWEEIMQNSSKLISFYDLGGSEKASKTTLSTLSPNYLDYFFLVVSAKQGITENTKLFLLLANSMNLPIISIFTMIDLVNEGDIEELLKNFKFLIKTLRLKKIPLIIRSVDDISLFSRNLNENIHPIIILSNKSGYGFDFLVNLLRFLPKDNSVKSNLSSDNLCQFDVHEHFVLGDEKENSGKLILGGIVARGRIMVGHKYYLGPDKLGNFKIVQVVDIHCKKVSVKVVYEGQFSSISLVKSETQTELKYEDIRKGMCLLDIHTSVPLACKSFQAEVWSIDGNTKSIKYKYEPVVTIKHIRQTCKVKKVENLNLIQEKSDEFDENFEEDPRDKRKKNKSKKIEKNEKNEKTGNTNDDFYTISPDQKVLLNFEFKNFPEFITVGSHLIINDSHLKSFGVITKIFK